jgi:DNA-binding GntR family transcriptional regulator
MPMPKDGHARQGVVRHAPPPPGLHQVAQDALRRKIVRGELAPGRRLSEPELCEMLGISRTPLREALKLLANEGLVTLRRNRSAIVAPLDPAALRCLFEAESCIESFAAGLAAERLTAAELKRLRTLQERMEKSQLRGDLDGYFYVNQQIHRLIVAGAKNPALCEAHDVLLGRLARARYMALAVQGRWEESILEHRRILSALESRDPEQSRDLFAHHIGRTGDIIAAYAAGPAGAASPNLPIAPNLPIEKEPSP